MRPSSGVSGAVGATTLPVGRVMFTSAVDKDYDDKNVASLRKFDGEWGVVGAVAPTTDGAMSKQKDVCTPTAEMKSDEYGGRPIASFVAIDEKEEGISGA